MYRNFVVKSPQMLDISSVISKIAPTNSPVLILGENGVGKSLVAEQIHLKSLRKEFSFVSVNCFSNSSLLFEKEFFVNTNDDFSSKDDFDLKGLIIKANNGTIFFDEIGELSLDLQKKLVDILQTKKITKKDSNTVLDVDFRIIASSSYNLESMVQKGTFLGELYYRISNFPLNIPALRNRKEDIEPLATYFCEKFSKKTKKNFTGFTQNALQMLYDYYWQGNVRELKNVIERACILGQPSLIHSSDLLLNFANSSELCDIQVSDLDDDKTLKSALHRFKKGFVIQVLNSVSWNQTEAAKIMGIQRTYLSKLMSDLDIRK